MFKRKPPAAEKAPYQPPGEAETMRLVQRNAEKRFDILSIGSGIVGMLSGAEMKGRGLEAIFPPRVLQHLAEQVDFEPDGVDISEALRKLSRITILAGEGNELPVILKIMPEGSDGVDTIYQLRLRPEAAEMTRAAKRPLAQAFTTRPHAQFDPASGLLTRASFTQDLEKLLGIMAKTPCTATLALILLDVATPEIETAMLQSVATAARQAFRSEDTIARISDHAVAVLLMDAPKSQAPIALNRFRMTLAQHPVMEQGRTHAIRALIAHDSIDAKDRPDTLLRYLDAAIKHHSPATDGSIIVELGQLGAGR